MERVKTLHEFFTTSNQFLKLQKVEIGALRGKILSEEIRKISENFKNIYTVFGTKTYDCLEQNDNSFLKAIFNYIYF